MKELVYDKCGFDLIDLKQNLESAEYRACSFSLYRKTIPYQVSKITPTKIGQFVTIKKRNKARLTEPFNILDDLDFIIIKSNVETILDNSWDFPTNQQSQKTKKGQAKYF